MREKPSRRSVGSLPKGFCFFTQARIQRAGSELRINSIPIIIR
jgi:hypothetical protein